MTDQDDSLTLTPDPHTQTSNDADVTIIDHDATSHAIVYHSLHDHHGDALNGVNSYAHLSNQFGPATFPPVLAHLLERGEAQQHPQVERARPMVMPGQRTERPALESIDDELIVTIGDTIDTSIDKTYTTPQSDPNVPANGVMGSTARFRLERHLGSGSFGEVLSAYDSDLNRRVALKRFFQSGERGLTTCREELKFVGRLEHPGIPSIHQVSVTRDGHPYLVMKLLEGQPLSNIITQLKSGDTSTHQEYPFTRRVELIIQLLRVISQAHQVGVLHRDIKPDHIYIGPRGELSLIDWGIAEDLEVTAAPTLLCGTPNYMSPEQASVGPLGPESDLFSIGAVAYELMCLTSAAPSGNSVTEILAKLPHHQPRLVDLVSHPSQPLVPAEFNTIIMRALHRDPRQRFRSASEMILEFERALSGQFNVVCSRTLLKRAAHRFMTWSERGRAHIIIAYLLILGIIAGLVLLGMWIGAARSY